MLAKFCDPVDVHVLFSELHEFQDTAGMGQVCLVVTCEPAINGYIISLPCFCSGIYFYGRICRMHETW
jgi:hypothetical protein